MVSAITGTGGSGGLGFVFLIALFTGSAGWAVARGGGQIPVASVQALTGSVTGSVADTLTGQPQLGQPRYGQPPYGQLQNGLPDPGYGQPRYYRAGTSQPPPDAGVRYTERGSQLLARPSLVGLALLAGSVAGATVAGGQRAAGGILLTVAVLTGFYLALVLLDLPNGIEIANGRFAVGVRGVPPAGRMWRRVSGPLDAVLSWEVHGGHALGETPSNHGASRHGGGDHGASHHGGGDHGASHHGGGDHGASHHGASHHGASHHGASQHGASQHGGHAGRRRGRARQRRAAGRPVQLLGDLRMFGRRRYLRLIVDPAAVQARLPARIMVGYVFVSAASAGAVWNGVILIGTRCPTALAAALEQALPGRLAQAPADRQEQ